MTAQIFNDKDVEILEKVLRLYPDMVMVAYAGKLAREKIQYPIQDHSGLLSLFDEKGFVELEGHTVSYEQAKEFMPQEFFPIENEEQFLTRVFLAFSRQNRFPDATQTKTFIDPTFNSSPTSFWTQKRG